ncbi:MAG: hypothetical protein IJ527_08475 [Prevotella sp.]|nr:hypothetical protein [Prevotella sp.]
MPDAGSSIFVDVLLVVLYLLLAVTLGLTIWSVLHSLHRRTREPQPTRMVSARTTGLVAGGLLVVALVLTFALASTQPLLINGDQFADALWLRLSDMFIFTTIIMLLVAIVGVVWGSTHRRFPWK